MGEESGAEAARGGSNRDRGKHVRDDRMTGLERDHVADVHERRREDRADRRAVKDPHGNQEIKVGSHRRQGAAGRGRAEADPDDADAPQSVGGEAPERLRQPVRQVVAGGRGGYGAERGVEVESDRDQDRRDREAVDHSHERTGRQQPDVEPQLSHRRTSA